MNAVDLKEFYDGREGRVVQRLLRQRIRALWPAVRGLKVVGVGHAMPYLNLFMDEAAGLFALIPERHGALFWPSRNATGLSAVYGDSGLPLETNSIDRLLAVHAAEDEEGLNTLLSESWRVLNGQGRLILIVPNRTGFWARSDSTPFGDGTPWSMRQARDALKRHSFVPEYTGRALFAPPTSSRLLLSFSGLMERIGPRFLSAFGGVNVLEASKRIYAAIPPTQADRVQIPRPRRLSPVTERGPVEINP